MRINMKTKHQAVFINAIGIAIVFLETLHFAGNFNLAIGISLIIIAVAIIGTIIAEIREEIRNLKDFAEAMSVIIDNDEWSLLKAN